MKRNIRAADVACYTMRPPCRLSKRLNGGDGQFTSASVMYGIAVAPTPKVPLSESPHMEIQLECE